MHHDYDLHYLHSSIVFMVLLLMDLRGLSLALKQLMWSFPHRGLDQPEDKPMDQPGGYTLSLPDLVAAPSEAFAGPSVDSQVDQCRYGSTIPMAVSQSSTLGLIWKVYVRDEQLWVHLVWMAFQAMASEVLNSTIHSHYVPGPHATPTLLPIPPPPSHQLPATHL